MEHKGPYREQADTGMETLEKMKKEIAAEGKVGIELPENIAADISVPLFSDALENKINPADIVLYSMATGILKYDGKTTLDKTILYIYRNHEIDSVWLSLRLFPKKSRPAKILNLFTKAYIEKKEANEKEENQRRLINQLDRHKKEIQNINKIVESGRTGDYGLYFVKALGKEKYFEKLKEIKTNAENLLAAVNDKLGEADKNENAADKKDK